MPSERAHIDLALHDLALVGHLCSSPAYHDWMAVVGFYAAIHAVEAMFARRKPPVHGQTHDRRRKILRGERRYENIFRYYRVLDTVATIARYLEATGPLKPQRRPRSVTVRTFDEYMDPETVLSKVIQHYLVSLLQSVATRLGHSDSARQIDRAVGGLQSLRLKTE